MDALTRQAGDLRAFGRYARRLPEFLSAVPTPRASTERIRRAVAGRDEAFVALLERAVYARPRSPYRRLLDHAGVELGDAQGLVAEHGTDGALGRLRDAGVFLTADELAGRTPVNRPGLAAFTVAEDDLENPLATGPAHTTRGSSEVPRRARFELGLLAHEAAHLDVSLRSGGVDHHAPVLWRPVPPGLSGMNDLLRFAHLGRRVERWFSQWPTAPSPRTTRHAALVAATRAIGARAGVPMPRPEHVPVDRADVVARWLAERKAAGAPPAFLATTSSCGVRVCAAALEEGHDIAGTVFRLGGEPFTEGREALLAEAGCRAIVHYAMTETGRIANACAAPEQRDDVHVLLDKLAVVQRPTRLPDGTQAGVLHFTTLLPLAPKVLINVESDDYAELEQRDCGCPLGDLGLTTHLHTIRSATKLNSEGMTFAGADLLELVDVALPGRFGGGPSDWQLVEGVEEGITRLYVVASPRVGPLDEAAVVEAVLRHLGRGADHRRLQARLWREGGTVRLRREEPRLTANGKVLPLSPPARPAPSRRAR